MGYLLSLLRSYFRDQGNVQKSRWARPYHQVTGNIDMRAIKGREGGQKGKMVNGPESGSASTGACHSYCVESEVFRSTLPQLKMPRVSKKQRINTKINKPKHS